MMLLSLLKTKQWYKNLIIFIPMLLTVIDWENILIVMIAFIAMCLTSSIVYICNDIIDKKEDQHHPSKKNRPIASGKTSIKFALVIISLLFIFILFTIFIDVKIFAICLLYMLINVIYNYKTKHIYIADITTISVGFILRGVLGAWVINVYMSPWLIICPFFVAMFLAVKKREKEYNELGINRKKHRKILEFYTKEKIGMLKTVLGVCVIISIAIYLFDRHQNFIMVIPIATYFVLKQL